MLAEFDQEMAQTRKVLERLPEDKFGWKPHEKSPTMGWLAAHVVSLPQWAKMTLATDSLDIAPPGGGEAPQPEAPPDRASLLAAFDRNVAGARAALASADSALLKGAWTLLAGGREIFTMPRAAVLRTFVMNHLIHHRAQLTLYLRLNDVPVPALYGPSADEGQM